jgi:hypothetical protein
MVFLNVVFVNSVDEEEFLLLPLRRPGGGFKDERWPKQTSTS